MNDQTIRSEAFDVVAYIVARLRNLDSMGTIFYK